jgi:hypothetical protein
VRGTSSNDSDGGETSCEHATRDGVGGSEWNYADLCVEGGVL